MLDPGSTINGLGSEGVSDGPSAGAIGGKTLNMHELSFEEAVQQILTNDSRFHREAYGFVRDALDHTKKTVGKKSLHVSGQQLLEGIREFGLSVYGPMTVTVFEEWGIKDCKDFGEIVFNLVENGVLAKTESDRRDDFANGYDFWEAFRKPFLPAARAAKKPGESNISDSKPEQTSLS